MVKLHRKYTDSTQFDNGTLPFGKALATALQWLYDDDEFEDDTISEEEYNRNWLYCMDGVLPICDFMSIVTDVIYMAFRDFGEPNIKNYMNQIQQGHQIGNSGLVLSYEGEYMILGKVGMATAEVILWSAYLYCHIRREFEPDNERAVRADKLMYKLYARQTCLKPELVKDTFLMKHLKKTMVTLLKNIPTDYEKQENNSAEGRTRYTLPTVEMINQKPELIESIGDIIAREKFEYSSMRQVFALLDERLMDKAILVISDKWDKLEKQRDERCYHVIGTYSDYSFERYGIYEKKQPMKRLKYFDIKQTLENIKKDELKQRETNHNFEKKLSTQPKKPKDTNSKPRPKSTKNKNAFTRETFTFKGLNEDQFKGQRTELFCDLLFKDFVAAKENETDIEKEKIEKLFTGIPLKKDEKIVWKGAKKELVCFFRQLKAHLEYSSKVSFWDIVASHFVIETEGKKIVQGKRKVRRVAISGDSLQHTSGKPKEDMMTKLEDCVKMLTIPIPELLKITMNKTEHDAQEDRDKAIAEKDLIRELKGYKKGGH